jgi:nitronate monooxygenase
VHYLTAPLRAAARQRGDAGGFHLWAGQTHPLAEAIPAAELVVQLATEARKALAHATGRFGAPA